MALVVKNPPANAGDAREASSIPGSGRSPGKGSDNPLHYSCLENSMDQMWEEPGRLVHGVSKCPTGLSMQTQATMNKGHLTREPLCYVRNSSIHLSANSYAFFPPDSAVTDFSVRRTVSIYPNQITKILKGVSELYQGIYLGCVQSLAKH